MNNYISSGKTKVLPEQTPIEAIYIGEVYLLDDSDPGFISVFRTSFGYRSYVYAFAEMVRRMNDIEQVF